MRQLQNKNVVKKILIGSKGDCFVFQIIDCSDFWNNYGYRWDYKQYLHIYDKICKHFASSNILFEKLFLTS